MAGTGAGKPYSILVLEDDDIDAEALKRGFGKGGIDNPLYFASSGADALKILHGEAAGGEDINPCIMLVDINMPRMNGLEFLKKVREDEKLSKNIAFMLTTSARAADIEAAYALNVAGYFLKTDIDALVALIRLYGNINQFSSL